jgi:Protein of unknown function (DUF1616)
MSLATILETVAGLLLVFFVPGYALCRATFPEWRLRGPGALRRLVETLTVSFVLNIVLTVLVGYALLSLAPGGFQAFWTDPVLEACLLGVAGAGFVAAAFRGAFSREVPRPRPEARPPSGEEGAWELTLELERLRREERRIRHALRVPKGSVADEEALRARLREVEAQSTDLARRREAEYAE